MGYTTSVYERETSITFNDGEDGASVYSASPKWIRKLDKLCGDNPGQFQCTGVDKVEGEITGKFYRVDKSLVSIRSRTRHQEFTEEQRTAAAERLRAARQSRTGQTAQDTI